ncbi:hypothetical protein RCL1_003986 [Eukaryota sp. TZLM3-RCL]
MTEILIAQGAEARVFKTDFHGRECLVKHRFPKQYRHPELDTSLREKRTNSEVKLLIKARSFGLPVPSLYLVDTKLCKIYMEYISGNPLRVVIHGLEPSFSSSLPTISSFFTQYGKLIAKLHTHDIVHGDLTTSNVLVSQSNSDLVLIDFGLAFPAASIEDKAVDLGVLEKSLVSSHINPHQLFQFFIEGYQESYEKSKEVLNRLEKVRQRGRKRTEMSV